MFEVGKIYKYKSSHLVYKCIAVCKDQGWMQSYNDDPITMCWCRDWKEYREPVVVKTRRYVGMWEDSIHLTHSKMRVIENLGEVEVTVTDGELTDVRIL